MTFNCGCAIAVKTGDDGVKRHRFTSHCERHFAKVRNFETENERMELVKQAYEVHTRRER